jgi:hypothetical protein
MKVKQSSAAGRPQIGDDVCAIISTREILDESHFSGLKADTTPGECDIIRTHDALLSAAKSTIIKRN